MPAAMAPATQRLKIPHTQLLIFTEQLAHLLQAGMTLDEGLAVLQKRLKHPRVQQMTQSLHRALVDGRSFSQALRDFPKIFPAIYVNLIAAGEASGALPEILRRLVEHRMQAKNLRDRVQQALIYPAFLAVAGAALMVIFITFMVPQLTNFMANNGGALPLPTRILVSVNAAIVGYWWLALALVVVIDADLAPVKQRVDELDARSPRQPGERIALVIPRRNIETWIRFLTAPPVDEETDYKPRNPDFGDTRQAAKALAALSTPPADAPDSLRQFFVEAARILP